MVTQNQPFQSFRSFKVIQKEAIDHALAGRWEAAVAVNLEGVEVDHADIGCYNRLAKAYLELSRYPEARASLERALEIDPGNRVSNRQMERLEYLDNSRAIKRTSGGTSTKSDLFISDPSCSTVSELKKIAPSELLAVISPGDRLEIEIGDGDTVVQTPGGDYVGTMEVRLAARLRKMIASGKKYEILAAKLSDSEVLIMVREINLSEQQGIKASFPPYLHKSISDFDLDDVLDTVDDMRLEDDMDEEISEPVEIELARSLLQEDFSESDMDAEL